MGIIETTLNNVAEATVGSPENNLNITMNNLSQESNNLTDKQTKMANGYAKIMALLSRANRK